MQNQWFDHLKVLNSARKKIGSSHSTDIAINLKMILLSQAYAGSQVLQSIILLCTGTNKGGGYFAPRGVFLAMYICLTIIWAVLNTFALEVIAIIDIISIWWQVNVYPHGSLICPTPLLFSGILYELQIGM